MRFLPPLSQKKKFPSKRLWYSLAAFLDLMLIIIILINGAASAKKIVEPLISPMLPLRSLHQGKNAKQIFGFAPYWNMEKLANVDFKILTTFAYFGIEVGADGNLIKDSAGYDTFKSAGATALFKKAHANGTRVVLTLTQMNNDAILDFLDSPQAQKNAIDQSVKLIKQRGVDGINIDFEYMGDPGQTYKNKFSNFIARMSDAVHQGIPFSQVTVSVYAASVKEAKIYDILPLANSTDGLFMMAYDFAVAGSDNAIPTAPLHGYQSGKYWYDVATAVDDFLKIIPANKLILGVPYYGYNYLVYNPSVKAETRPWYSWRGKPASQTYSVVTDKFSQQVEGVDQITRGWDDDGKVGYIAYHVVDTDTWRMIFMEDSKSLGIKYDFAKQKNLAGVGMWALGNDQGKSELWDLLDEKFGTKALASNIFPRSISDIDE